MVTLFQFGGFYFQNALYVLDQIGFTDVFLPFILIFTVVFATLQKISLFGAESRKFNSIIALALSIGVIIPHSLGKYPPGTDIVVILNTALPNVSLLIVSIVFLLIVIGMFGGKAVWGETFIGGAVTLIALALVITIFGSAAGWWQTSGALRALSDPNIQAAILIIAVFWLIISTITKEKEEEGAVTKLGKFFGAIEEATKEKKEGK